MTDIDFAKLEWLNPPLSAARAGKALTVTTRQASDFWQHTFYGFRRDSGHFLYQTVTGDFTVSVKFTGRFEALYDQAGLMVRSDETHWVKAGIEFTDGERFLSAVVSNGFSDWSVQPYRTAAPEVSIRLTRHGEAIRVQFQDPQDGKWIMARLGYLKAAAALQVGVMCCSPERAGFEVTFRQFRIAPAIDRALHAKG
jgi:regulation of enolase protein 1 (concanavalin A-like superfamily)